MSYRIGSFNLFKFNYASKKDVKKDFKQIAGIIKQERFDVVALQEVFSEGALKQLLDSLGNNWEGRWASPRSVSSSAAEGYAFVWNTKRLHLADGREPQIHNMYRIRGDIGEGSLLRPPYVGRFTPQDLPGGCNFEFRLINTHIIFSKSSQITDSLGDTALRRAELTTLSREVYRRVSTKRYGNNLPAYTILLGDYNLCLVGDGPTIKEEIPITRNRNLITVQKDLTSLKEKQTEASKQSGANPYSGPDGYYSMNYDHFSFDKDYRDRSGIRFDAFRIEALGKYCNNDLEKYRDTISDHVPIKLVVDLKSR